MIVNQKISEDIFLFYIEDNMSSFNDANEKYEVSTYELWFSFMGKEGFVVYVTKESLSKENSSYASIEGPSNLFASFEEVMEDEHWEDVKKHCKLFDEYYEQNQ